MSNLMNDFEETKDLMTPRCLNDVGACETMDDKRSYLVKLKAQMLDAEIKAAEIALLAQRAMNDAAEIALNAQKAVNVARKAAYGPSKATKDPAVYTFNERNTEGDRDYNDDAISVLDSKGTADMRGDKGNRGIVKACLKDLFENPLTTNELGATLVFARKIEQLFRFGGTESPLNFLNAARREALKDYVAETDGDGLPFNIRYLDPGPDAQQFIQDLTMASIKSRGLTEDHYLDHCRMPTTSKFSFEAVDNYLAEVKTDIASLPPMTDHSKVMQIFENLQPLWLKEMILKNHQWVLSVGTVDEIVKIIRTEALAEQTTADRINEGYGQCFKATDGNGDDGNGGSGSNGGSKYRGINGSNGGGYGGNIKCFNCDGNHKIGNCQELCKKCAIPCGKKVWECPVYLKNREKALKKEAGTDRDTFLNQKYSSNNAVVRRLAKKAKAQLQEIKTPDRKGIYGRTQTPQASDVSSDSDDSGDEESD